MGNCVQTFQRWNNGGSFMSDASALLYPVVHMSVKYNGNNWEKLLRADVDSASPRYPLLRACAIRRLRYGRKCPR